MEFAILFGLFLLAGRAARGKRKPGPTPEPEPDPEPQPDEPEPQPEPPPDPIPGFSPLWPLPSSPRKWRPSSFSSGRPWASANPTSHHSGIDIRAKEGDPVRVPREGVVIGKTGWRGPNTRGVLFQSFGGPMLVFGAVAPGSFPPAGTILERGELIGRIGRYPGGDTMLHFEVWKVGTTKRQKWLWNQPQPAALVNPHQYLLATVTT